MRSIVLALCIMATQPQAQTVTTDPTGQSVTAQMQALPVHVGGRVNAVTLGPDLPPGAIRYEHQWPGTYFEAGFMGQQVVLRFDDDMNEYRLFIDELPPITLAQPGAVDITISGLLAEPHLLRLEKVTESIGITRAFGGFYVPDSAQPIPVAPRPRQIEFIGDSDMTGYGLRSTSRECSEDQVRLLSDAQVSYPALLGKYFGADYQVNAISGRGLVRNYDGFSPEIAMAQIYPNNLMDAGGSYDDPRWQPQIIFIGLGSNDYSTALSPDEDWADDRTLTAALIAAYETLITDLYAQHPNVTIIVLTPVNDIMPEAEATSAYFELERALQARAAQIGNTSLGFLDIGDTPAENTACHYHGTLRDHQARAIRLIDYLTRFPDMWDGQDPMP